MSDFAVRFPSGMAEMLKDQWLALGSMLPGDFANYGEEIRDGAFRAARNYSDYLVGRDVPGRGCLKRPAVLRGSVICRFLSTAAWTVGHEDDAARLIDVGQPERDMKQSLPDSRKARRSAAGNLYLIIPFRHGSNGDGQGTRGMRPMSPEVYRLAAQMAYSRVTGMGKRLSATGHVVPQAAYRWGDRLPAGLAPKLRPEHKGDIYAGMVRFRNTAVSGNRSVYMTFRTMSQNSPARSWIRPAQPAMMLLDTAIREAWDGSAEARESALWADVQVLLASAVG